MYAGYIKNFYTSVRGKNQMEKYAYFEEIFQKIVKHIKRNSISLVIKKMQVKATMKYGYKPTRKAKFKA